MAKPADAGVRAVFGDPPRVFDDETRRAAYPYAVIERHEATPAGASLYEVIEHRITLSTRSRESGRAEALKAVGALRAAIETAELAPSGQNVVLAHVVYADVMRANDLRAFRGLIRVRIVSERIAQ